MGTVLQIQTLLIRFPTSSLNPPQPSLLPAPCPLLSQNKRFQRKRLRSLVQMFSNILSNKMAGAQEWETYVTSGKRGDNFMRISFSKFWGTRLGRRAGRAWPWILWNVKLLYPEQLLCLSNTSLGGRNSSLVVFGLAVHSVAGSILLWGNFPVEGIFPLELTWVQTPFPKKLFRMRV